MGPNRKNKGNKLLKKSFCKNGFKASKAIPDAKPLSDFVAAVSVGIIDGVPMLDLCYEEDVRAGTDMNVVVAGDGRFIEVQGTAEGEPFDRDLLNQLLDLAVDGCSTLNTMQKAVLAQ